MAIKENGVAVAKTQRGFANSNNNYPAGTVNIRQEFTNYSHSSIYMKSQANIPFVVEPNRLGGSDESREHLEIKQIYEVTTPESIYATYELLTSFVQNNVLLSEDAQSILEQLQTLHARDAQMRTHRFQFATVKRVLLDEIVREERLYVREVDMVVAARKAYIQAPHPNSKEGLQNVDIAGNKAYQGHSGFFVRVVDNDQLCPKRYIFSAKKVIEVPSVIDKTRESGVYYTINTVDDQGVVTPTSHYCTFEQAEELLGLYRTQEQAITWGNPLKINELEAAKLRENEIVLKREEQKLKADLARLQHEHDVEAVQGKRELTRMQQMLEELKSENTMLKEYRDVRSLVRTDEFEETNQRRKENVEKLKAQSEAKKLKAERKKFEMERRKMELDLAKKAREDRYDQASTARKSTLDVLKFIPALLLGAAGIWAVASRN